MVTVVSVLLLSMHLELTNRISGQGCTFVNLCYPDAKCFKYQLKPVSGVEAIQQIEENCSTKFQNHCGDSDLI